MVRVGVDERILPELLAGMPAGASVVRLPVKVVEPVEVDFWMLPFFRRDAAETFVMLRGVKVVQSMMAGVEWILPWLPKEVVLCDGSGIHDISTSEWVLAAILASLKRMPAYRDLQNRGEWPGKGSTAVAAQPHGHFQVMGDDLAGKTALIVGYGSIGQAIESRLLAFGVDVLRVARSARAEPLVHDAASLHSLLPEADVVVLVVPTTPQTRGMIGTAEIGLMKPGALLVNAARGVVVQTDALLKALAEGRIHAALDVTDPEPLPPEHPLWFAPNCLITPHVAGSTPQLPIRALHLGMAQVRRFVAGTPLKNIVGANGY